mmetsp:Transcript_31529/g.44767  ORF Transcript_31529/g.44767 Transcript_31529/m.44767 type:complete len:121 (+) Transcript_31529:42-404(+)
MICRDGDHIEFGTDKLGMEINGDENDTIDFGWFKHTASEDGSSGTSTSGNIQWSIKSKSVTDSPQGYSRDFDDQEHMISIVIPSQYFATSHSLSLTITWDLNDSDEIVGIDDFSVSGCAA